MFFIVISLVFNKSNQQALPPPNKTESNILQVMQNNVITINCSI